MQLKFAGLKLSNLNFQMDKASLLTEVISHLKELKKDATEAGKEFLIPTDINEVSVEAEKDELGRAPCSIRASLCCNYKPGLLSDIRQALDTLHLIIVKAEVATLGSRMKNTILVAGYEEENSNDIAARYSLVKSVHKAFASAVDKFLASEEDDTESRVLNKRRRVSLFGSSFSSLSSSPSGYPW